MKYNKLYIEKKILNKHKKLNFFKINKNSKKKYYILNMFPYPSGYGLHIGHSTGYIFSDIISKYKSGLGYKILNPIGFDSFGLPAEQYAINTGNHPINIINKSIKKYIKQIKLLGVFFNWDKIINTSNYKYYKWTQWIFIKLFNSYYDKKHNKARNINILFKKYKKKYTKEKINKLLNKYRLAYLKYSYVNWCPKLKSVLSNDEIKKGKSIRGGYSIIPIKMVQWHLRITKYINKLLKGIKTLNWPNYVKNSQIKWIGNQKVYYFNLILINKKIKIYTKKKSNNIKIIVINYPSKYVDIILNNINKKKRKKIIKLLNKCYYNYKLFNIYIKIKNNLNKKIKFFISNYFNNKYLKNIFILYKNDQINKIFKYNINNYVINFFKKKVIFLKFNFKKKYINNLKDIVFSRQRYWGEPIPIYYKNNIPYNIKLNELPLKLPFIKKNYFIKKKNILNKYNKWAWDINNKKVTYNKLINYIDIFPLDNNTMPSYAASNWYYLRYIDPNFNKFLVNKKKLNFWKNVDLYIGGIEHVNGHLLYSRFCNLFLKDINIVNFKEPYKKFINQGTILNNTYSIYIYKKYIISYDLINKYKKNNIQKVYIEKKYVKYNNILNIKKYKKKKNKNYIYKKNKKNILLCKNSLEKMSKSKFNIITPDSIIKKYGIDCYRLYIMFLGPFTKKKIWNVEKINGIKRFLKKIWNYCLIKKNLNINNKYKYYINNYINIINNYYKKLYLHKNISIFMEFLNFLIKKKIYNNKIKKKFLILLSPYVPYITEYLWNKIGGKKSIFYEKIPIYKKKIKYIKYLIMINNKIKDIIYIIKNKNTLKYIKSIINTKNYFTKIKNNIKKYIFIKNKVLNILI